MSPSKRNDDDEPTAEEAKALMFKLLQDAGAAIDPNELAAIEAAEAKEAATDAVDGRRDAKPLLGFDARPRGPSVPAVGRGARKKT